MNVTKVQSVATKAVYHVSQQQIVNVTTGKVIPENTKTARRLRGFVGGNGVTASGKPHNRFKLVE